MKNNVAINATILHVNCVPISFLRISSLEQRRSNIPATINIEAIQSMKVPISMSSWMIDTTKDVLMLFPFVILKNQHTYVYFNSTGNYILLSLC